MNSEKNTTNSSAIMAVLASMMKLLCTFIKILKKSLDPFFATLPQLKKDASKAFCAIFGFFGTIADAFDVDEVFKWLWFFNEIRWGDRDSVIRTENES